MDIDTQDKISAQINQARGVLALLLADSSDLKSDSSLSLEMHNNAIWVVDSLLEQLEQTLQTGTQA